MPRVLLTRTAAQGASFERALSQLAAERGIPDLRVEFAPMQVARTVEPSHPLFSALSLAAEGAFLWVTFTSANAVRACIELFGESFAWALHESGTRVACVGAATARALREIGLEPQFIPERQDAQGMLAQFPAEGATPGRGVPESLMIRNDGMDSAVLGQDDVSDAPANVLVIEGANARPTLREGLQAMGFHAVRAVVYEMVPVSGSMLEPGEIPCHEARDLVNGADSSTLDVIVATAPSRLKELVGQNPHAERIPPVVAIGHTTGRTCEHLGLRHMVADSPAPEDLASAALEVLLGA